MLRRKEGNVLFNDALNTFYLQLYGVIYMVKDHSDSERGNLLLPCYEKRKEGNVLFNDPLQHILFTVIWRHIYGKESFR